MSIITRRQLLCGGASAAAVGAVPVEARPRAISHRDVAFVQVRKSKRLLELVSHDRRVLKPYAIQLGHTPRGHKRFINDGRTPEGRYRIDRRNPQSRYYLSLGISYPNQADRSYAAAHGRSPGGDIFIHGQPNGARGTIARDWTAGWHRCGQR